MTTEVIERKKKNQSVLGRDEIEFPVVAALSVLSQCRPPSAVADNVCLLMTPSGERGRERIIR